MTFTCECREAYLAFPAERSKLYLAVSLLMVARLVRKVKLNFASRSTVLKSTAATKDRL